MATTSVGYCSPEDVRDALQEANLSGPLNEAITEAHILGESEWIQEDTNRHWYDPDAADSDLVGNSPLTFSEDELDIDASPHSGSAQLFRSDSGGWAEPRYPVRHAGPYTAVRPQRRDVREVTELLVRDATGEFEDWVASSEYQEGRGEDYYLQVDDATGQTRLYLDIGQLPRLADYDAAVVASYEYGVDELPGTVRQATASLAGAAMLREDGQTAGVPDDGQLVNLATRADELYERGMRLLEIHR